MRERGGGRGRGRRWRFLDEGKRLSLGRGGGRRRRKIEKLRRLFVETVRRILFVEIVLRNMSVEVFEAAVVINTMGNGRKVVERHVVVDVVVEVVVVVDVDVVPRHGSVVRRLWH